MSSSNKVTFKVVFISDKNRPFKIFSVPDDTPFAVFMKFASEQFGISYEDSAIINSNGIAIHTKNTAGRIFLEHGSELSLIQTESRD
ncbi:ubiquitin-fold modifier 1 isoform X1 [Cryptosporidium xiaoi]|uniref:Ubiquitin-fold modifier 1 n=1 Tax=Cryptosporidium xiaoi TaxID=659607 RepID=A0AAV9XT01_9CRYT